MKKAFFLCAALMTLWIASCGGGGGGNAGGNTGSIVSNEKRFIYVDSAGVCNGRTPCYALLIDAVIDSFASQFDDQLNQIHPNAPPDRIVVMPGVYTTDIPGDWILVLGFNGEDGISGIWKLEIFAEQGPETTVISGLNTGPCVWVVDNIELHIEGFTFTGCAEVAPFVINDDYSIYVQSFLKAKVRIEGNVFHDNTSPSSAIGINPFFVNIFELEVKIIGNRFYNNSGAVHLQGFPSPVLPQYSGHVQIANNIVYNNGRDTTAVYSAGGIRMFNFTTAEQNIKIDVVNNTITDNRGVGLSLLQAQGINARNNIVHGHTIDIDELFSISTVTNNLVGEISRLSSSANVVGNPMFANAAAGDFSLNVGSPAIDAGVALSIAELQVDFLGQARPVDGNGDGVAVPDIGAIELQ